MARWQDWGTLLALPSMQVHSRLAQQLGGALGASGGSSPPLIPVFRIPGQAWQPFAQNFLYIPWQLKGLLFPPGKNKRQRQLCVSSQADTAWKEKLPSPRSPLYLNGCSLQMWSHSLATGELGGLSCHGCGRGYITRTAHTHTNPETAPGQASRVVSHRWPRCKGPREGMHKPGGPMTCHRSHCSFRPHSPFSGRTLGSIRERSIKSILGSLQTHSYLWPI